MAVLKKKKTKAAPKKKTLPARRPAALKARVPLRKKSKPAVKKTVKKIKPKTKKAPTTKTRAKKPAATKQATVKKTGPELERFTGNPIITPTGRISWESRATFNPTAIVHDNIVHLLYRAVGDSDVSVLGYAKSTDGYTFEKLSEQAAYAHNSKETPDKSVPSIGYVSGGGWSGGCEDPRLVRIGDMVYMTYTAFDGWGSVRIALTSIPLDDFIHQKWNWKKPVLISPPGEIHKNWVLFPEKIKGNYAIIHAITPHIFIEYIDDLRRFDGNMFIDSIHRDSPSWQLRDKEIRGVGPAPIRTKYGWLLLYHGTEQSDSNKYKLWAMLLDLKDPTKILYKSRRPVLEPEAPYENLGYKWGIVYACGAVIKDGKLFVYYGGADTVACVATADIDAFLEELISSGNPRLTPEIKKRK